MLEYPIPQWCVVPLNTPWYSSPSMWHRTGQVIINALYTSVCILPFLVIHTSHYNHVIHTSHYDHVIHTSHYDHGMHAPHYDMMLPCFSGHL